VLEAHHVRDKFDPSRRRGFGFVTMGSVDEAAAAVAALAASEISGRSLVVNFALAPSDRPPRQSFHEQGSYRDGAWRETGPSSFRGRREGGGAPSAADPRKLYVGNLSFDTSSEALAQLFGEFGAVERAAHAEERDVPGRRRGFGFVTFADEASASAAAAKLNGSELDGRTIVVNVAKPRGVLGGWGST